MTVWQRGGLKFATSILVVLSLSACASSGVSVNNLAAPEQIAPVQQGSVATTALPPIGPNGEVQGPTDVQGVPNGDAPVNGQFGVTGDMQTADTGSIDNVAPVGGLPNARDLSGGITVEKMLGGWTVVAGADQCKLNLTQTAKNGTSRYRASAPACALPALAGVASWQLAGSQVQLFDDSGSIIAALILSGNRFIGTLNGGQGISMVG